MQTIQDNLESISSYSAQAEDTGLEQGGDELMPSEQPAPPAKTILGLTYATVFKLSIVIILLVGVVLGLTVWDLDERIQSLLEWLEDNRVEGIAIFIALYTALTAVFFPSSILTLAGGAVYGFWGIPIVWLGATLGQTLAFLLARYLLHEMVKGWASKYAVWKGINAAITEHSLKMTILVRLATLIPYSVTNALLPITNISFWKYTVGSAIGILPGVCLYVMLGSLAGGIAMVSAGQMDDMNSPILLFTTVGVSIVILIILIVVLTRYAKRALAEQVQKVEAEEAAGQEVDTSARQDPSVNDSQSEEDGA